MKQLTSNKGFTLIELMIVVVIVAILASAGVPAYKRMVQKSRKGEAQVLLAAVATGESLFQAEFGTYGDNLARMNVQSESGKFVYAVGFNAGACANFANNGFLPATVPGQPQYQTLAVDASGNSWGNMIGRPAASQTVCLATVAVTATGYTASATGFIGSGSGAVTDCNGALANCDQWTITQGRVISNVVDGIK